MAYIYKITNLVNQKSYIGQTFYTIEKRWKEHLEHKSLDRPLYKAFAKYGIENFKIEELECCEDNKANEREMYWIEYYKTFDNGYNLTRGGEGQQLINKQQVLLLWQQNKTITEIASETGFQRNTVAAVLDYYKIPKEERFQRGYYSEGKAVAQLDKDSLEVIAVFPTLTDAALALGKTKKHAGSIGQVCNGKKNRKTAYGYKWKFIE